MGILRIAIIDDLITDSEKLRRDIICWIARSGTNTVAECTCFNSGTEFLERNSFPESFALVFLDICMPQKNGLDTAKEFRRINREGLIVFVTTEKEYALDAYPVHPFDFLIKPYAPDRLERVLQDAFDFLKKTPEEISVRIAYGTVTIPVNSIVSISASGHNVEYHLEDLEVLNSSVSFKEAASGLCSFGCFLEINRGVMINMNQVKHLGEDHVTMNDGNTWPIRVRGRIDLLRTLTQYQIKNRMGGI